MTPRCCGEGGGQEVARWQQHARLTLLIWHRELWSPDIRRPLPLNLTVMGALSPMPNRWRHSRFRVVTASPMSRPLWRHVWFSSRLPGLDQLCVLPAVGVFTFRDQFYKLLSKLLLVIWMFHYIRTLSILLSQSSVIINLDLHSQYFTPKHGKSRSNHLSFLS